MSLRLDYHDSILFTTIYRQPEAFLSNTFTNEFYNFYCYFKNLIIVGDLDCDFLTTNFEANYLRDMTNSSFLKIFGTEPNHHTDVSDTSLDLFIVHDLSKVVRFTKSAAPFIASHDPLTLVYRYMMPSHFGPLARRRKNYANI